MEFDSFYQLWNNEIEPRLANMEMWLALNSLGIKPFKAGNQWGFLYGENIQEGICGFGDTIDEAAVNFYTELCKNK